MNSTTNSSQGIAQQLSKQASSATMETAQQAFQHFTHGAASGDWEPFIDSVTEDCTFEITLPVEQWLGKQVGKNKVADFFHFERDELGLQLFITLDNVTSNENTVGFEFDVEGHVAGNYYKNRIALFFDVRGDKISGFREYAGAIDPKAVIRASSV